MWSYCLKRLSLIPITLIGITLIVFALSRFMPGGPLERALMEIKMMSNQHPGMNTGLSEEQLLSLKAYYGLDKTWYEGYIHWILKILQGDLGTSQRYQEPVWNMIVERLPISLFYGSISIILIYGICIPLGILKSIKRQTAIDYITSFIIFFAYGLPSYVLGSFLIVFFAGYLNICPIGGFISDEFYTLSLWGKSKDLLYHSVLPITCYIMGSFAFVTLLMRNTLSDQLSAPFMQAAIARGLSFKEAVIQHGLRNSLIPLATDFGQNLTLILSGSFLIETLFDIDGFGLLGYTALLDRDYPIIMGILLLSSCLFLTGNLLSDILLATIDPRIRFH